ncbi:MAG: D-glycero-beta-D-manno-heptose 1-phosphate adenylyltransferase [Candidatus Latescibacterota bacterium]|nr:MAG: D-glycero-beta-D-manno-heptose 1-phosphate adenylyltransferase [Candidatus Latescibacterota bacterium]
MGRVLGEKELIGERARAAARGLRFVFTNGCFDLLHAGHLDVLRAAKGAGDLLAIGLNADDSVRRLKGEGRPLVGEGERAELLAALEMVDFVVLFHEDTPARLIEALAPDVLVKGGDYAPGEIVGSDFVRARGGTVLVVPLRPGASTRGLIDEIVERYGRGG